MSSEGDRPFQNCANAVYLVSCPLIGMQGTSFMPCSLYILYALFITVLGHERTAARLSSSTSLLCNSNDKVVPKRQTTSVDSSVLIYCECWHITDQQGKTHLRKTEMNNHCFDYLSTLPRMSFIINITPQCCLIL